LRADNEHGQVRVPFFRDWLVCRDVLLIDTKHSSCHDEQTFHAELATNDAFTTFRRQPIYTDFVSLPMLLFFVVVVSNDIFA
jgi:hypothetical protein